MLVTASEVATLLQAKGYNPVRHLEGDDVLDGSVELNDRIRVQVSALNQGYGVACREPDGAFLMYPIRHQFSDLLKDLNLALEKPQEQERAA